MSNNLIAGKKRKWSEVTKADPSTILHGKIHHYAKELKKAAKKAKRFEIQRLVKRMRETRKAEDNAQSKINIVEWESQLEILKEIDLERIAGLALTSKIRRDKLLSSNEILLDTLGAFPFSTAERSTDSQTVKVENKMLSSSVFASEVVAAVNGLKKILYPDSDEKSADTRAKLKDKSRGGEEDEDEWSGIKEMKDISKPSSEAASQDDYLSDEGEERSIEAAGWESGSLDDDMEGEAYSGDDVSLSSRPPQKKRETSHPRKNIQLSEGNLSSQFLPSLSVGYVKGDSGSEFNSDEEEPKKERKNGRGQRARQAIWAKKYGKNANHIKKEQKVTLSRTFANDKKMGNGRVNNGESFNKSRPNHESVVFGQARSKPVETKEALHPSWEAKRMLKSKESAQILPPQGKKLVFS